MVCGNIEKSSGLLIVAFILLSSLIFVPDWNIVGIAAGANIMQRFAFSFFHASFIHAAANAWCFLSILFIYDISWRRIFVAFLIAAAAPDCVLSDTPTVGLSAICFALLGSINFQVRRKIYFNTCMAAYIAIGLLLPSVNGWIHLYAYIAGLFVGLLNMPIKCKK